MLGLGLFKLTSETEPGAKSRTKYKTTRPAAPSLRPALGTRGFVQDRKSECGTVGNHRTTNRTIRHFGSRGVRRTGVRGPARGDLARTIELPSLHTLWDWEKQGLDLNGT